VADVGKILGQKAPSTTLTDLYTVPDGTEVTTSTLMICNISGSGVTYRVAIRPKGASIQNYHYIYYGKSLAANESFAAILGLTLEQNDVVSVWGSDANVIFNLFGVETS
jgi:hypothetical protein